VPFVSEAQRRYFNANRDKLEKQGMGPYGVVPPAGQGYRGVLLPGYLRYGDITPIENTALE